LSVPEPAGSEFTAGVSTLGRPVVAVLTYQRVPELAALLPVLVGQSRVADPPCDIMVVDNDPEAGAAQAVSQVAGVQYVHEPRPGIAAARNRALSEGAGRSSLVFLDDDEEPVSGWLQALLDLHRRTGAAGVVGPVVSQFSQEPGSWIGAGEVFARRRLPTGTEVVVAATNNLLLDLVQVQRLGLQFDERFGLSGGSDTLFTRQLTRAGGRLVWCDEALVVDNVPPDRATRQWVLRRSLRSGNTWARTSLLLADRGSGAILERARLLIAGSARMLGGAVKTAIGFAVRSPRRRARGERAAMRGLGMVLGTLGVVRMEYRRQSATS
jgi:succinoglycan biosynthesis protein ExoM